MWLPFEMISIEVFLRPSVLISNETQIISAEINFIGNLVGSYNDLSELMVLAAQGKVVLHTTKYKLEEFQKALDDLPADKVRSRAILVP